jgi:hypothetical protein
MRLVGVAAHLVTGRSGGLLLFVTAAAGGRLLAVVRVVAADAFGMPGYDATTFCGVARTALRHRQQRAVGQTGVTALAVLVARRNRHLRELCGMTIQAGSMIRDLTHEIVGCVTALTVYPRVKLGILGRGLVATTAGARRRVSLSPVGMRVVAAHARAGGAGLRMIRVHVLMTFGARLLGAAAHVVGRVAVRALLMALGVRAAQCGNVLVAPPARRGLLFAELVGPMAAHTLPVPRREQGRLRNERLLLGVT